MKKIKKKSNNKYNLHKLKQPIKKKQMKDYLNKECEILSGILNIEGIKKLNNTVENIKWEILKPDTVKKKSWMMEEILQLMEKRICLKNSNLREYSNIDEIIKKKIREAKEEEMREKCIEM